MVCRCGASRERWRVITRRGNYSAFSGYRFTPSAYSMLTCLECRAVWRSKARYVAAVADVTDAELGIRSEPVEPQFAPYAERRARSVCELCGKPGGPMLGPLTVADGHLVHRDGCGAA